MTQSTASAGIEEITHCGPAGRAADAKVLFLQGADNHISNVAIIIDDENLLRLALIPTTRG